jgi:hypothetical protein
LLICLSKKESGKDLFEYVIGRSNMTILVSYNSNGTRKT